MNTLEKLKIDKLQCIKVISCLYNNNYTAYSSVGHAGLKKIAAYIEKLENRIKDLEEKYESDSNNN